MKTWGDPAALRCHPQFTCPQGSNPPEAVPQVELCKEHDKIRTQRHSKTKGINRDQMILGSRMDVYLYSFTVSPGRESEL